MVHNELKYKPKIMKSITIHGMDDEIYESVKDLARKTGMSLNKTIKGLLKKSLNMDSNTKKSELTEFVGIWIEKEAEEFSGKLKDFEKIDKSDWV